MTYNVHLYIFLHFYIIIQATNKELIQMLQTSANQLTKGILHDPE